VKKIKYIVREQDKKPQEKIYDSTQHKKPKRLKYTWICRLLWHSARH